mmetsp:Transcript_30609/g.71906  ORF Transcript_30609/g.71906 Transcript_30609/m.71906 type:complete len:200 (+) Transcript_30609:697-1296(+)
MRGAPIATDTASTTWPTRCAATSTAATASPAAKANASGGPCTAATSAPARPLAGATRPTQPAGWPVANDASSDDRSAPRLVRSGEPWEGTVPCGAATSRWSPAANAAHVGAHAPTSERSAEPGAVRRDTHNTGCELLDIAPLAPRATRLTRCAVERHALLGVAPAHSSVGRGRDAAPWGRSAAAASGCRSPSLAEWAKP